MSIPALIHQFYTSPVTTADPLPARVVEEMGLWAAYHPQFGYKAWSLKNVLESIDDESLFGSAVTLEDVLGCMKAIRFPAVQSDLARLVIMYAHGGFWSDVKFVPAYPFLHEVDPAISLVLVEHMSNAAVPDPASRGILISGFFGACPRHPLIGEALELVVSRVKNRVKAGGVWELFGPGVLSRCARGRFPGLFLSSFDGVEAWRGSDFFDVRVKWGSAGKGNYNGSNNELHWSVREKTESVYLDA